MSRKHTHTTASTGIVSVTSVFSLTPNYWDWFDQASPEYSDKKQTVNTCLTQLLGGSVQLITLSPDFLGSSLTLIFEFPNGVHPDTEVPTPHISTVNSELEREVSKILENTWDITLEVRVFYTNFTPFS
jgi:hypothetical protein